MADQPSTQTTQTFDTPGRVPSGTAPRPAGAPDLPDYEVIGRLGEGGMGVVWRATQRSTHRAVALKLLAPSTVGSQRARARFEREVELAARLEHPNIARVYDAGLHNGQPYYAMQLIEGLPLDLYVRGEQLDREGILRLMRRVCEAVQHAHQRGIIHRDLKPSNIMVDNDGQPVVVDFGLAKATELDGTDIQTLSVEGQVAGTPAYMAPEQAAGRIKDVDTRSDVYALGVILYRLLTGASPHDLSGSSLDVLKRIAEDDVCPPRRVSDDASRVIDRELETVLLKALAKDPDGRYESAGGLAHDLDNYLSGEPVSARRPTATYILRKRVRKHRKALAGVAAAVCLLFIAAGAGAGWLYQRPVNMPIDSRPTGASIVVNGVPRPGCGLTPCSVKLGPGSHTIELVRDGHYQPFKRRVIVAWGQVSSEAFEPIVLSPAFRTLIITTGPKNVRGEIRTMNGEVFGAFDTPHTITLPRGNYTLHLADANGTLSESGETLQILGNAEPLSLHRAR